MAPTAWRRLLTVDSLLRLMVVLLFVAFLQTVFFGFVYDDYPLITTNPWLESAAGLKAMFTHHSWGFDETLPARHYRPVFLVWLWVVARGLGPAPGFFHLASLLTHLLATLLAYVLGRELMKDGRKAVLVAMLFALHPTKVESVSWIAAAPEQLNAAFLFGSMYAYIKGRRDPRRNWPWLALSSLGFALALMTKETAVILPGLLLAWEVFIFRADGERQSWKQSLACVAPLLAAMVGFLAVRAHILHGLGDEAGKRSLLTTAYTAPMACWLWIRQILWPIHMSTLYPPMILEHPTFRMFVFPAVTLLAVLGLYVRWARNNPLLKFAAAWMVLTALPVIGEFTWVQLHDRHLYLPIFAVAMMLVIAAEQLVVKAKDAPQALTLACVSLALVFTAVSAVEARVWDSSVAVFERAVEVSPTNTEAVDLLSQSYEQSGRYADAEATLRKGLALVPQSARLKISMGMQLDRFGKPMEASQYLRSALAQKLPDDRRASVLYTLSEIDWNHNNREQAKEEIREAIRLRPNVAAFKTVLTQFQRESAR